MADSIPEIEDGNFESEVLQSDMPVLVDFWAPWCGPCKAIAPVVAELSNDFGDKIKFMKCNVDNSPVTPGKYGIKAIPTGFEHGTVLAVIADVGYEITTLRKDIETDGRRAVVAFGTHFAADAERRDFTINALYVDRTGAILLARRRSLGTRRAGSTGGA